MMKILTTKQIREADEFTIKNEPILSIDLMERACQAFVDWFVARYPNQYTVLIVCGTGNNGGDGLGIARLLFEKKYNIRVSIIRMSKSQSFDFKENLSRLPRRLTFNTMGPGDKIEFPDTDIIIDALFGSGLTRPLQGIASEVVSILNEKNAERIAVDCPSGFMMDVESHGPSVQAHHTVTFQLPKLSFMFPRSYPFVGQWHLVNIGLSQTYIDNAETNFFLIDDAEVRSLLRPRKKFDHKGNFGHTLIMAGSKGKVGANILATRAALSVGSGLVTSVVPGCGYIPLQVAVPEAMVLTDENESELSMLPKLDPFNAIGVGPGIGTSKNTTEYLYSLFKTCKVPCVIDADALNIIASNPEIKKLIPSSSIITPHPGEFKRLVGEFSGDFEKLSLQIKLASEINSIVILKGAHTSIALPTGEVYFNNTGNPYMATGGSGDALTGLITGLLAQQYSARAAAIIGVYLHGLAGDLAIKERAPITASNIIAEVPNAIQSLS